MKTQLKQTVSLCDPSNNGINPVFVNGAEFIMIGTVTIWDGQQNGFYYTSSKNAFWPLVDGYFNSKGTIPKSRFDAIKKNSTNKRADFVKELTRLKISICDIFKYCHFEDEKNNKGVITKSTKDENIIHENNYSSNICDQYSYNTYEYEIRDYLSRNPNVQVIINGKLAWDIFNSWNIKLNKAARLTVSPSGRASITLKAKQYCWNGVMNGDLILP